MANTRNILLVGCGNIGSRILQSILQTSQLSDFSELKIDIVDPAPNLEALVETRISEIFGTWSRGDTSEIKGNGFSITLHKSIPEMQDGPDLGIIATTSNIRPQLLDELLQKTSPRRLMLEKFLFQNLSDYPHFEKLLMDAGIPVWVHAPRAEWAHYQSLKQELTAPIDVTITGSDFFLASNAIHFIEIFAYLSGGRVTQVDASGTFEGKGNKRAGFRELYGTLKAQGANDSRISISCQEGGELPVIIDIKHGGGRVEIDETVEKVTFYDPSGGVIKTEDFPFVFVSQMPETYAKMLLDRPVVLPNFFDSQHHHCDLLKAFNAVFFDDADVNTACPIT